MAEPLPGPRLLVPTDLTALVVTDGAAREEYTWADVTADYTQFGNDIFLGDQILPDPLTTMPAPNPGIHLHWALPDALTKGKQGPKGMAYPLVPNRWLVTRSWWDEAAQKAQSKAWVVQSDALSGTQGAQCVSWPVRVDASRVLWKSWLPSPRSYVTPYVQEWLGDVMDAGSWTGETVPSVEPFLTAVGPGDPTFAACYWNCRGVFSLWDEATDLDPGAGTLELTYSVAGWYSDATKGPLAGYTDAKAWAARMKELKWIVPEGTDAAPTDVLVHGLLHSVAWGGPDAAYQSGVPSGEIDVSFGNTSAEALAALLRTKLGADHDVEAVLEAFQYGVLAEYEGQDPDLALAQALHEREFGSSQGGTTWDVHRKAGATAGSDVAAPLPAGVAVALATLNDSQSQVDAARRALASARQKLYLIWFRKAELDISISGPVPPFDQLPAVIQDKLCALVDARKATLLTLEAQLVADRTALETALAAALPDYELAELAAPRFWQPNNPVALLSGPGVVRSYRHGADDRFGDLLCRAAGQTVTAITVESETVGASGLGAFTGTPPAIGGPVPAEVPALALETALLAPSLAEAIARAALAAAGVSDPTAQQVSDMTAAAQAVQNGAWNADRNRGVDTQSLAAAAGITGTVPSKIAVSYWSQPWIPLSFQWDASWFPSSVDATDPLAGWTLGGPDYTWDGGSPDANPDVGVPGAAPMNPAAAAGLGAAITKYLADHPSDPNAQALRDIATATANLNVVAQALSGFNASLGGTKETLQFPVIDPVSPDLGTAVAQRVGDANGLSPAVSPKVTSSAQTFFPIRAGHLLFGELRVVDAFGQSQEVIAPNADPNLICSTPLTTQSAPTLAQLPPRIAQPSRLSFRFVAASPAPPISPVAAWLLPNRLDASLMVYDGRGEMQGELQTIEGSLNPAGQGVRWVPAPGVPVTYGAGPDLGPHAQPFAQEMIALSAGGTSALPQFMGAIDEALWGVNPLGSWSDQSLAQLVGRPLALVRASLALELDGDPSFDTTWAAVQNLIEDGSFSDFGLTDAAFTVTLGNSELLKDGLVGYFFDDDYSRFYLAQYAQTPPAGGYVLPAQPIPLKPNAPPTLLTMVVDPRAALHATSGILPTKSITLPPDQTAAALAAMVITFMAGPLVTDSKVLSAPTPGGASRGWSWLEHPSPAEWRTDQLIPPPKTTAELSASTQRIVDGWLKRSGAFGSGGGPRSGRGR